MQAVRALGDRTTGTLTAIEHDLWVALLGVGVIGNRWLHGIGGNVAGAATA